MKVEGNIFAGKGRLCGLLAMLCFAVATFAARVPESPRPVYDVLRERDDNFVPLSVGRIVTVRGTLTTRPVRDDKRWTAYFQDETGGLVLVGLTPKVLANVKEGDTVVATGKIAHSGGMEELIVQKILLESSGEVPKPRDVWSTDINSERYAGQLVRVSGEIIATQRDDGAVFILRDLEGEIALIIPPSFLTWNQGQLNYALWKGGKGEVIGIAAQQKGSPPFNGGYGVIPREPTDISFAPLPPPPPSSLPLYVTFAIAGALALLAIYFADRRRLAEKRTAEVSRLLHEIERSEAEVKKQAAFAEFNPNPILEFFADGTMTYSNDAARELTAELQRDYVADILPPGTRDIVRECISTQKPRLKCDVTIAGRTLSWSFHPIHERTSVHAYGCDITEQLNVEAQLRQSQKLDSIGQLAAGIAHDFNNLLSVIQGYATLSLMRSDLPDKMIEPMHEIATAAERASNLTRQLLTFSKHQTLAVRPLELNGLVSNLTRMLRRLLGEDVHLHFDRVDTDAWIEADQGMMEQIIVNLAVNARDAMPDGGELTIGLSRHNLTASQVEHRMEARPGDFFCLSVTDTGQGMDEATLKRIFEPFFTTKGEGKGTGLGLATVHGIVKQHKGWIEVSSKVSKGTAFRIYLPAAIDAAGAADMNVIPLPIPGGIETILVVEDDAALRKLARDVLVEYGYTVLDAGSSQQAISMWHQHGGRIQLLLTDIVLPDGMSGWKLAEILRSHSSDLKVIYSTGFDLQSVNRRFADIPDAVMLKKPYPVHQLVWSVRTSLDSIAPVQTLGTAQIS